MLHGKPAPLAARRLVGLFCTLWLLALLAACAPATAPTPQAKEPVRVQLAWTHSIEYAGFYTAQDEGTYAAAGLDVTLDVLGKTAPIDAVVSGQAQFGITSADGVLFARAAGKPVVAIATIYQRSPVAFVSLTANNITRPQDFVNKKVVVDLKGTTAIIYRALLVSQAIKSEQVTTIPRVDYTNDALLSGQADVMDAFINNQPIQLRRQGHDVNVVLPSDYGIDLYANVIFTTEELIAKRPELVAAFVKATTQGMQQAITDPQAATKRALARSKELDAVSEAEAMQLALPLMNPAGSRPGWMSAERWQAISQMLHDQQLLEDSLEVKTAYNLAFLEQAYER
jgi:NitT/TauT family transport system substrate-binding protein